MATTRCFTCERAIANLARERCAACGSAWEENSRAWAARPGLDCWIIPAGLALLLALGLWMEVWPSGTATDKLFVLTATLGLGVLLILFNHRVRRRSFLGVAPAWLII